MSQILPFVCGPAALIRFLNWRGSSIANDLRNQIRIWRTANTVYMGQGPAGCDGAGLLRAADELGEAVMLLRTRPEFSFAGTVRDPDHKAVIHMVEQENLEFARERGRLRLCDDMAHALDTIGRQPLLLLCSMRAYSMSNEHHWIACRPKGDSAELYDPSEGQYETRLKADFFDSFRTRGSSETLLAYSKYFYDIIF